LQVTELIIHFRPTISDSDYLHSCSDAAPAVNPQF